MEETENISITESENTHKTGSKRVLPVVLVALVLVLLLAGMYLYFVRQVTDSFHYELGDKISEDLHDYVEGFDFAIDMSELDLSGIEDRAGVYYAFVKHFPFTYRYEIEIRDTIAPVITGFKSEEIFEVDRVYDVSDLYTGIYDKDPEVSVQFVKEKYNSNDKINVDGAKISFTDCTEADVRVRATDSSGNTSEVTLHAIADTPPEITAYEDYYVAKGTNALLSCKAQDKHDGNVTDTISMDLSPNYYLTTGLYETKITASDDYGLTSEKYTRVHVYEPETIQDMINTDRLSGLAANVYGALNPYDAGYLVEDNIAEARERLIPAIVRVSYEKPSYTSYGSGSIVKISEKGIIICTNGHVVDDEEYVQVHFYDGTIVYGKVEGKSDKPDIAFVRVNLNEVKKELIKKLKTAHINLEYYQSLSDKPSFEVGMYCTDGEGGEWLTRYGQIKRKSGMLDQYFERFNYAVTEVTVDLTPGVSGSMVFDSHGNFICMASFYWQNGEIKENYGVSLDSILTFYEVTFGKRLEYN